MEKFKIKRTKGMSYKNYIKEEYDIICCFKCRIKVTLAFHGGLYHIVLLWRFLLRFDCGLYVSL